MTATSLDRDGSTISELACAGCYFGRVEHWGAVVNAAKAYCASYRSPDFDLATAPRCSAAYVPGACG